MIFSLWRCPSLQPELHAAHASAGSGDGLRDQLLGFFSLHSTPPVDQSEGLMSNNNTSTLSGEPPKVLTAASVKAATKLRFCSGVRPSNNSTRMVGMEILLLKK